jgi:hypothetical protein
MADLEILESEKEHSTFGASSSQRWLNCPGSIKLAKKGPPEVESEYAKEGTRAHACLEFLLRNRTNLKSATVVAAKTWPKEMIEHALTAVHWVENELATSPGELLIETRVDASWHTQEGEFGTLDIGIVREFDRLTIADYKYGAGDVVEPEGDDGEGNSQLVYYGLALAAAYEHNFSELELVVIQPRAYHHTGETIRRHMMPMAKAMEWRNKFLLAVHNAQRPNATIKAGKWCKYCRAAVICPELKDKSMKRAQAVFNDQEGLISTVEPMMVPVPHLGNMLDAAERLEQWIAKVREHASHVLLRGHKVPGWKMVAKRSPRRWVNREKAEEDAGVEFGTLAFESPQLLSPAQLEKVAKGRPGLEEWIAKRVTNESSGSTLARESDKRPAVNSIDMAFGGDNALLEAELPKPKKR